MSLRIVTDSSANLPEESIAAYQIAVIPLTLMVNGERMLCYEAGKPFDGESFYERMRQDAKLELKTSMVNTAEFIDVFEPMLQAGDDVLYVAMSSGISGTYSAGALAAKELSERYKERTILAVDTRAASMGEGLMVLEAAALREKGMDAGQIVEYLEQRRSLMRQHFLVDDLMFLKRGGRISAAAAVAGTIINIKPIMKGDVDGKIVLDRKVMGRKKALRTLAELYENWHISNDDNCSFSIAHGGCEDDAQSLADMIMQFDPKANVTIVCYEPGTGAHVGPGTVALFFWGEVKPLQKVPVIPTIRNKIVSEADNLRAAIENKLHRDE